VFGLVVPSIALDSSRHRGRGEHWFRSRGAIPVAGPTGNGLRIQSTVVFGFWVVRRWIASNKIIFLFHYRPGSAARPPKNPRTRPSRAPCARGVHAPAAGATAAPRTPALWPPAYRSARPTSPPYPAPQLSASKPRAPDPLACDRQLASAAVSADQSFYYCFELTFYWRIDCSGSNPLFRPLLSSPAHGSPSLKQATTYGILFGKVYPWVWYGIAQPRL
jgi:hypothetical protein